MTSLGKKIISAFVDVKADDHTAASPHKEAVPAVTPVTGGVSGTAPVPRPAGDQRFAEYFDKLFDDANIPGPDYYEFARMIAAMQMIPDEAARYAAAFAGLRVQGLDKEKLLSTAGEYLRVLSTDAGHFQQTVEAALQEKVSRRTAEAEEKGRRIQA